MKYYDALRLVALAVASLCLASCAMTWKMDGVERLASDDWATLTYMPDERFSPMVFVVEVDGVDRGVGDFVEFRLLPGDRVVKVLGNIGLFQYKVSIRFYAEAGKVYQLRYDRHSMQKSYWTPYIVDMTTGQRVDYSHDAGKVDVIYKKMFPDLHKHQNHPPVN